MKTSYQSIVYLTQAELTARQTAGTLPTAGTTIHIVDNAGVFIEEKKSTGASSQPTTVSGGGSGATATGVRTGTNFVLTYSPDPITPISGTIIDFIPNAAYVAGDTIGGATIQEQENGTLNALESGDMVAGGFYRLRYNGTGWVIEGQSDSTEALKLKLDKTESPNIIDWTPNTPVRINEVRRVPISGSLFAGALVDADIVRSTSARTTGAVFDGTEANFWTLVARNTLYTPGQSAGLVDDSLVRKSTQGFQVTPDDSTLVTEKLIKDNLDLKQARTVYTTPQNANNLVSPGVHVSGNGAGALTNGPSGNSAWSITVAAMVSGVNTYIQQLFSTDNNDMYTRKRDNGTIWSTWTKVLNGTILESEVTGLPADLIAAAANKKVTIHVGASNLAITEALHNNAEIHLEGTGNLTILNTAITTDTFGFTVINTDAGATRTLTPTGFAGVFLRDGSGPLDLGNNLFNIADNTKYRFTVTLNGADRYLNIESVNIPVLKTINGQDIKGTGNLTIAASALQTRDFNAHVDSTAIPTARKQHNRGDEIAQADGVQVSTWGNVAGSNLTEGTTTGLLATTVNGQKGVNFAGGASQAYHAGSTIYNDAAYTVFVVAAHNAGANSTYRGLASNRNNNATTFGTSSTAWWTLGMTSANVIALEGAGISTAYDPRGTGMQLYSARLASGDRQLYRNGTSMATSATTNALSDANSKLKIGTWLDASQTWNGQIMEIIIYPVALSTLNRQKIEGYLAWKHNLVANLDVSHPYKTTAFQVSSTPEYADEAAAIAGGLISGDLYRTGSILKVVLAG